jgi:hypothetical protein
MQSTLFACLGRVALLSHANVVPTHDLLLKLILLLPWIPELLKPRSEPAGAETATWDATAVAMADPEGKQGSFDLEKGDEMS